MQIFWLLRSSVFHGAVLLAVVLTVFACPSPSPAVDPPAGSWNWIDTLPKINALAASVGSSCRIWLDKYSTSSYRVWKRCGVNSTASGVQVIDYYLPGSIAGSHAGASYNLGGNRIVVNGDGTLGISSITTVPGSNAPFSTHANVSGVDATSGLVLGSGGNGTHSDYQLSCTGAPIAGGSVDASLGSTYTTNSFVGSYLRDTSTGHNTIGAVCRAADSLLFDFGNINPTCSTSVTVTSVTRGYETTVGDCGCVPVGSVISAAPVGPSCTFTRLYGDPGGQGTDLPSSIGLVESKQGSTFTNDDLVRFGNTIPIAGTSGSGGVADGYGIGTSSGTATPAPGSGGGGTGVGAGAGSGGAGTGSGNCPPGVVNCNGDGSPDTGSVPSLPSYDSTISGMPTETSPSWTQQILDFVAGSPAVTAITGSGLTASGSCSLSASVMGAAVDLGFCNIPSSFFTIMAAALMLIAHLVAFFIIFR